MTITSISSELRGLADELRALEDSKRDFMADTDRISFNPETLTLDVDVPGGAESFGVTEHAHGQVATHLDLPKRTYDRLRHDYPDLFAHLTNGLLGREQARRRMRTINGNVRAFLSDRYRPRDNWDLLNDAVLPAFSDHPATVEFRECKLTETRMYIKVSLPEFEGIVDPEVGDIVQGGLIIKNSEVGAGRLVVAPWTYRLDCKNGMTHMEYGQGSVHIGRRDQSEEEAFEIFSDETLRLDDAAFYAKCRDAIRATLTNVVFEKIIGEMRELAGIRVKAPGQVVEIVADKVGMTESEKVSMLDALLLGGDTSAWGVVNAVTWTARDLLDADRKSELEDQAGRLVSSDQSWAVAVAA